LASSESTCASTTSRSADWSLAVRVAGQCPWPSSFALVASYLPVAVLRHAASSNGLCLKERSADFSAHLATAPNSLTRFFWTPSAHFSACALDVGHVSTARAHCGERARSPTTTAISFMEYPPVARWIDVADRAWRACGERVSGTSSAQHVGIRVSLPH